MPSKNSIKSYVADGYYHIYNRGVNKRTIFKSELDYSTFLSYLKVYLLPKDKEKLFSIIANTNSSPKEKERATQLLLLNNFHNRIELLAYCLMPNHFHFLIHQKEEKDLESFMRSLMTKYTKYFNHQYSRLGPLFQGNYKAVLVATDPQLLHLTRYIHLNPFKISNNQNTHESLLLQPSSYPVYLGEVKQEWVKPKFILQNFSNTGLNSYQSFVEDTDSDLELESAITTAKVTIDDD